MKSIPKLVIYLIPYLIILTAVGFSLFQSETIPTLQFWFKQMFFILGAGIGYIIPEIDKFIDVYFTNPETKLAIVAKEYIGRHQYRNAYLILDKNQQLQKKLTFHSALFQVIWVFLAFFTLSSTDTILGKSFILGIGWHLLLDEWKGYSNNKQLLKEWLFWQINREITDKELRIYMIVLSLISCYFFAIYLYQLI